MCRHPISPALKLLLGLTWVLAACSRSPTEQHGPVALLAAWSSEAITIDGHLGDPVWQRATRVELRRFDGRAPARQATSVRAAWTAQDLLLAFECQDEDVFSRYQKRDDPLYLAEAVEVFLDPDGNRTDYMEFEVSPAGVLFDASFSARRQGMDLAFNPSSRVAVRVAGTLDQREDKDEGWSVELAIPFADLREPTPRVPRAGDCWRANLFRLDKSRGAEEASSWRPTPGDFHDLNAFGALCFLGP
jgi:hypothetical protein